MRNFLKALVRFRNLFMLLGSLAVIAALFLTDVDHGAGAAMVLLRLAACVLAVSFAFLSTKAMFDYKAADKQNLFSKAGEESTGAGLALVAWAIVFYGLLSLFTSGLRG